MDDRVAQPPRIQIERYGQIPERIAQAIHQRVTLCYQAMDTALPEVVYLCLFDTLRRWQDYAIQQRIDAGVVTAGEEGFLATHDAWEGTPRLNVCLERLLAHPEPVQQGALHQVVAHSVLHGQPDDYRFLIPRQLIVASRAQGIDIEVLQQVLYLVAIAIKGYAAVSLLVKQGFILDQVALARYQLEGNKDDIPLWKMARWEPRARLLYLAAQLKPLLYLQPLLPHAPSLAPSSRAMLAHLPPEDVERLESLVETLIERYTGDTHQDVTTALILVMNRLLAPHPRDASGIRGRILS